MGFSLVVVSGGDSLLPCVGISLRWLHLLRSTGSGVPGLQQLPLPGSRALALWCDAQPWWLRSMWGLLEQCRQILTPSAAREVPRIPAVSCSSAPTCRAASLPAWAGVGVPQAVGSPPSPEVSTPQSVSCIWLLSVVLKWLFNNCPVFAPIMSLPGVLRMFLNI